MNPGWEAFGGWRIFAIAVVYALFGLLLAEHFSRKRGFAVPTGIMAAFRGEFFLMDSGSEAGRFFSLCVNHLLIAVGAVLSRRAFAVFGGIGTSIYIGHLAWRVFEGSPFFPFALSLVGFAVIWTGILWQRREKQITAALRSFLPVRVGEFLENEQ